MSLREGGYTDQDLCQLAQGGEEAGVDQGGREELEGIRVGGQEKNLGANHREPPVTSVSRYQEVTVRHALLMSANSLGAYRLV